MIIAGRVPTRRLLTGASNLEQLFEHELEDIYFAEHELVDALEGLADQVEDEEIKQTLLDHRNQTEDHVDRIEEAFNMIKPSEEEAFFDELKRLTEDYDHDRPAA